MSRLPSYTNASVPEAALPYLRAVTHDLPAPLNFQAQMAHAPAVIASYAGIRRALTEYGTLDPKTRTAIMLAASDALHAAYPVAVNTRLAGLAGWTPEQISALRAGHSATDPALAALLTLVRQAAGNIGHVEDTAWAAAAGAGWSDGQLAEAFAYLGVTVYVAYFTHYTDTPLDIAYAPAGR